MQSLRPLKRQRAQGRPGGRMHPGPPAQKELREARGPQVQAVTTGLPCAVVYGLLRALLGEPACCHRRLATSAHHGPVGLSAKLARLDACMGAPGPHDFAVREPLHQNARGGISRISRRISDGDALSAARPAPFDRSRQSRPATTRARRSRVHRILKAQRFVTFARRPSSRARTMQACIISEKTK